MSDFAERLLAAIQVAEDSVAPLRLEGRIVGPRTDAERTTLRRCAADREIVTEVSSWRHFYSDGDTWFSCGLAVGDYSDGEPGSGCADDSVRGRCTCALESRQNRILLPLARFYGLEVTE